MNGSFKLKCSKIVYGGSVSCWLSAIGIAFLITLGLSGMWITTNQLSLSPTIQHQEYWRLVRYLLTPGQRLAFQELALSSRANHHFTEVKFMVQGGLLIWIVSLLTSWWGWYQLKNRGQLWQLSTVLKFSLMGWLILIVMIIIDFGDWFLQLHQVVFTNHDWIFSPRADQIINLLPVKFFLRFTLVWGGITSLLIGSLIGLANQQTKQLFRQLRTHPTNNGWDQRNNNDTNDN